MTMVHATVTGPITGTEYRESKTTHRHLPRWVKLRAGAQITYDPDKYVYRSQPIVLANGRTIWVPIAVLTRYTAVNAYQGAARRRVPHPHTRVARRSIRAEKLRRSRVARRQKRDSVGRFR